MKDEGRDSGIDERGEKVDLNGLGPEGRRIYIYIYITWSQKCVTCISQHLSYALYAFKHII